MQQLTVSHWCAVRGLFDEEVLGPRRQILKVERHVVLQIERGTRDKHV